MRTIPLLVASAALASLSLPAQNPSFPLQSVTGRLTSHALPPSPTPAQRVTVEFEVTPRADRGDFVTGLSPQLAVSSFGDMFAIVRFWTNGRVDVRDGSTYRADTVYPYARGVRYAFRLELDFSTKRYDVAVRTADREGGWQDLATDCAFRTEQQAAIGYASLGLFAGDVGSGTRRHTVHAFERRAVAVAEVGPPTSGGGALSCPDETAVQLALNARFVWFDRNLSGGAHAWVFNGGEFGKAAIAFCGDTRADGRLLDQIRHLLVPGNGLTCTGGFQDQKQLGSTAMFTLAKHTPRIWNRLSPTERAKIDLMVYGALVSSAFTTSDRNPYVASGGRQRTLDGSFNVSRDWNPNYRNGMLGTVVVASLYFGPAEAQRLLRAHDHPAFVSALRAAGLDNLHATHTIPAANRPTRGDIEGCLHRNWTYYGTPITDPLGVYLAVTEYTFNRSVHCGLNGGQGRVGSNGVRGGYVRTCGGIPNAGQLGMLTEFDSGDGSGPRSAAHYANDGWYPNLYIHYVLCALGQWRDTSRSRAALDRIRIGTTDLFFKIDPTRGGGYHDYRSGRGYANPYVLDDGLGHRLNRSLADVLDRFHG